MTVNWHAVAVSAFKSIAKYPLVWRGLRVLASKVMLGDTCQFLSKVDGVGSVRATLVDRSVTVTFDDAITDLHEIRKIIVDCGYATFKIDTEMGS